MNAIEVQQYSRHPPLAHLPYMNNVLGSSPRGTRLLAPPRGSPLQQTYQESSGRLIPPTESQSYIFTIQSRPAHLRPGPVSVPAVLLFQLVVLLPPASATTPPPPLISPSASPALIASLVPGGSTMCGVELICPTSHDRNHCPSASTTQRCSFKVSAVLDMILLF